MRIEKSICSTAHCHYDCKTSRATAPIAMATPWGMLNDCRLEYAGIRLRFVRRAEMREFLCNMHDIKKGGT